MTSLRVLLLTAVLAVLAAAPARAGIWTPVASGTTADITAVDYRAADSLFYATAAGTILKNGTQQFSSPGTAFNDIAFNPSGTVGIAVGSSAKIVRTANGTTWAAVPAINVKTYNHASPCSGGGGPYALTTYTTSSPLYAVAWASDTTAYAVGADKGVVLKTTDGGQNWTDVSRRSDGTCYVNGGPLTDVATIAGTDVVWIVSDNFGKRFISSNGLASSASEQGTTAANCFDKRPRLALDTVNTNRSFVSDRCTGTLQWGFSEDSGVNYELSLEFPNGDGSSLTGLNDTAIAGGAAIAVGNGGAILVSLNGRQAYFQRADGADATDDWLAVDKFDAGNAAVVGKGGRILVSAQSNAIPDVVKPAGTISGPVKVAAGTPVQYTANVSDNAGGSGIDPNGFTWSATGLPNVTGNPATVTWPSAGSYTLTVTFKDLAGNTSTASLSVQVTPAPPTGTVTKSFALGTGTLGAPKACIATGKQLAASFRFKKRRGASTKVVKVEFFVDGKRKRSDSRAPFKQRISTRGLASGTRHTLKTRATLRFGGGSRTRITLTTTFRIC